MVAKDSLDRFPCFRQPVCSKAALTAQMKTTKMYIGRCSFPGAVDIC